MYISVNGQLTELNGFAERMPRLDCVLVDLGYRDRKVERTTAPTLSQRPSTTITCAPAPHRPFRPYSLAMADCAAAALRV